MGIRGELFSTKVELPNRTYFFNVKENRMGDLYLNVVESKNRETGGFERQSVILFADDLQEFLSGFEESLRVMEKAVREKRRGGGRPPAAPRAAREDYAPDGSAPSLPRKRVLVKRDGERRGGGRPPAAPRAARGDYAPDGSSPPRRKRVLVKRDGERWGEGRPPAAPRAARGDYAPDGSSLPAWRERAPANRDGERRPGRNGGPKPEGYRPGKPKEPGERPFKPGRRKPY